MDELTFPASELDRALSAPFVMDILLNYQGYEENHHGFVIGLSTNFVMLQNIQDWHVDGFIIVPLTHIQAWKQKPAKTDILTFNKIAKSTAPDWINLNSLAELLWCLKAREMIVFVSISDYGEVGYVTSVSKSHVVLKGIDSSGGIIDEPVEVRLNDIDYIQFGDEYTTVLSRFVTAKTASDQ